MENNIHISVILPVYNGARYLHKAIESVLTQTYPHFELIILNDGSKDNSDNIIRSFNDARIVYLQHNNMGLGATLNAGLSIARGIYIARQDQDDFSYPQRFEKQLEFLKQHPQIILTGTWARILQNHEVVIGFHKHSCSPALLHFDMLFDNPFVHSSVMFRKEVIDKSGGYIIERDTYEDFDLWSRFLNHGKLANIPEILIDYCHHDLGMSKSFQNFREDALPARGAANMAQLTGKLDSAYSDLTAVYHYKQKLYMGTDKDILYALIDELANQLVKRYPEAKTALLKRARAYKQLIRYRLNVLKINDASSAILTKFISRLDNKWHTANEFVNRANETFIP